MNNRRRSGLGSGLDALFNPGDTERTGGVQQIAVEQIRPNPRQPRTVFDEVALNELAESIKEHGLIQPLIVSERDGGYELIAGERRWRASQRAGLSIVPVIVREVAPQQLLELALIENVQRADLNALEEARAYQALVDDFGLTDGEIARRLGKGSREVIANTRRLLQLNQEAQAALLKGQISAGHGRAILKIKDLDQQQAMVQAIIEQELSVRTAERLADFVLQYGDTTQALQMVQKNVSRQTGPTGTVSKPAQAASTPNQLSADDQEIARALERILRTPVSLTRTDRELRVTIAFHTEEMLQEFFDWVNTRT